MKISLKETEYTYSPDTAFASKALDGISLELGEPGFAAIIGRTGSGKSTLIRLLNGLIRPTGGKILFDGEDIYALTDYKKRLRQLRCRVGVAFQYPESQLFESEVIADVAYGPGNLGLSKDEAYARARKALEDVGFPKENYKSSPFELSGGQMRRAAIAGVLAMEPEILVLDEPTAGLDPAGKEEILDRIKEIQDARKISVILVTHSMEEAARYAQRTIVLDGGRILFDDETAKVFSHHEQLEKTGLGVPAARRFAEDLKAAGFDLDTDVINAAQAADSIARALGADV